MHSVPFIEGYKILSKIGEGATSVVWRAHQLSLDRTVVIKILSDKLSQEHEDAKLFLTEAQTAAKLKHSGIVQVYDFGQIKNDGRYFFVMEYVSGYTVGEWARRRGRIKESDAVVIAHHVGEALKYAWDQTHVIHCDIKPDNLMIDADGTVKVMDLGLAHMVFAKGIPAGNADDSIVMGTPNYMSPEQAAGNNNLDCRTDIYALGMTLYHVLTGVLPYGNGDELDIIERQIKEPLPDPQTVNPDLSTDISRLISKMTAKNISERFQNWSEVLTAIVSLLHQQRAHSLSGTGKHEAAPAGVEPGEKKPKPDDAINLQEEFKECPYCAEPIRKKAVYCRYCGKYLEKLPPKTGAPVHNSTKLRLKPVAAMPAATPPPDIKKPKAKPARRRSSWGGNLRMILSLLLVGFLIYYWYNKIKYERDVLMPWKIKFMRQVGTPTKMAGAKMIKQIKGFLGEDIEDEDTNEEAPSGQSATP